MGYPSQTTVPHNSVHSPRKTTIIYITLDQPIYSVQPVGCKPDFDGIIESLTYTLRIAKLEPKRAADNYQNPKSVGVPA
jgi:hypothetical protein